MEKIEKYNRETGYASVYVFREQGITFYPLQKFRTRNFNRKEMHTESHR